MCVPKDSKKNLIRPANQKKLPNPELGQTFLLYAFRYVVMPER